jgi:hypothetical protein
MFGGSLSAAELSELRQRIRVRPFAYVAQERLPLSSAPSFTQEGVQPRHVSLRVFMSRHDDGYIAMPGALTRVANSKDSLVVSMQQGGGSKDTWVLSPPSHRSSGRGPTEHTEDADDHVEPQTDVPLTVAEIPAAVMPKLAETQRQQQSNQQQSNQQQSNQQQSNQRSRGC